MDTTGASVQLVEESDDPDVAATFARLSAKSIGVVNIHRTIANSPKVFSCFIALAHALRFDTELDPAERELAVLCVLERHGGSYELTHHRRLGIAAGLSQEQVDNVRSPGSTELYSQRQLQLLQFAERFAADPKDRDALPDPKIEISDRSRVELALTLALYVGLSHFTTVLNVPYDRSA